MDCKCCEENGTGDDVTCGGKGGGGHGGRPMAVGKEGDALSRAADWVKDTGKCKQPDLSGGIGCGSAGGDRKLSVASGNMVLQLKTPSVGPFDARPILTYNSKSTTTTEIGYGWRALFGPKVTEINSTTADVAKGSGAVLRYTAQGRQRPVHAAAGSEGCTQEEYGRHLDGDAAR